MSIAGGGLLNEWNATNKIMDELLGVQQLGAFTADSDCFYIKQDLNFVPTLDTVHLHQAGLHLRNVVAAIGMPVINDTKVGTNTSLVVKGRKLILHQASSPVDATETSVLGTFASDGSAAVIQHAFAGGGRAVIAAFPVGLAYFDGAIPLRPVDRGSTDANMNHFCPHDFTASARDLLASMVTDLVGARPLIPSDPLVEVGALVTEKAVAVVLVNWRGQPVQNLTVHADSTLGLPSAEKLHVERASGEKVTAGVAGGAAAGGLTFVLDLDVADAIVLRWE